MINSPEKRQRQCQAWQHVVLYTAAIVAAVSAILHVQGHDEWNIWDRAMIYSLVFAAMGWCAWVMLLFRDIISWWRDMYDEMSRASRLLEESRRDLADLKKSATTN